MTSRSLAIVLAAGEGTRMRSALPKVLHPVAGLPMVCHVLRACRDAGVDDIAVVVGSGADAVRARVAEDDPGATFHEQASRDGTAHAVLAARAAVSEGHDEVLVLFGDVPLVLPSTIALLRERMAGGADVAVMGFHTSDPKGYGRLVMEGKKLVRIVEERDASDEERAASFCNSGIMGFRAEHVLSLLEAVGNENAQGEYYLPDTVAIAHARGLRVDALEVSEEETLGVNDRVQLADREGRWQRRARKAAMRAGVTMQAPDTVTLNADTALGRDCVLEPNVWFGPGVSVGEDTRLRANTHVEGARIGSRCEIGPFARLRPGTVIEDGVKVGNFVEVKGAVLREGAKVNHLSYVGNADVGRAANIGAGAVTANYDGFGKYETLIGPGAFVGTNSTLVAPVRVGANANVAAGSVITSDVPDESLSFGRARQVDKPGRAARFRAEAAERKARKAAVKGS